MKQLFVFLLLGGFWSSGLFAEPSAQEKFAKQDQALNQVYGELKKELEPHLFEVVKKDQRGWVKYREYMSEWQKGYEGTSDEEAQLELGAGLTESRVEWLEAWLKTEQNEGMAGEYDDGYGGLLQIVKEGKDYFFSLQVVRGPTFHVGHLTGKLRVNGSTAWFEIQEEGEEPTWLTLVPKEDGSRRLRVVSENAHFYHGARAYFEGSYLKVGKVSPEERKKVIAGEL